MPALSLDVESSSMSYYLSLVERRVAEFYHNIDRTILIAVATPVPDSKHKQTQTYQNFSHFVAKCSLRHFRHECHKKTCYTRYEKIILGRICCEKVVRAWIAAMLF